MAKKKRKLEWQFQILLIGVMILGVIFLPTTVMLMVGMLPTIVLALIDNTKGRVKTMTVGAMNLAGCTPFIIEMWMTSHTMQTSIDFITTPRTIVVIYFSAAIGYMIDWALTGIVSTIMYEKGKIRLDQIEKEQDHLVERWGLEVTGKMPMDAYGFAIPEEELEEQQKIQEDQEKKKKTETEEKTD